MYLQCYRNKVHAKEVKEPTLHTLRLQDTDNVYLISDMLYVLLFVFLVDIEDEVVTYSSS